MLIAGVIFCAALTGIIVLFALKHWELSRGYTLAPRMRARGDARALHLKELAFAARRDTSKLLPEVIRLLRLVLHETALALASAARLLERQAHKLADTVSMKRGFERRETRSEFLKKVAERKTATLDTTDSNGHNSEMPR